MAILSIVLISTMFSVGYAQYMTPRFDGRVTGTSTDEAEGTTTMHVKIIASDDFAGQEVEIEWKKPDSSGVVKRTVTLDQNGDYEGDLTDLPGFNGVGEDETVLKSKTGQVYARDRGKWVYVKSKIRVPIAVGGFVVPVDKFGLLAPYIGLASTILAATVATAIYVKRVKPRKEKQ